MKSALHPAAQKRSENMDGKTTKKEEKCVVVGFGEHPECRGNVVMTRLSDEDLEQIDALVEIDAFRSRSEAAAFFIKEGIKAREDLFHEVMPTVNKIRELKEQAKRSLSGIETESGGV